MFLGMAIEIAVALNCCLYFQSPPNCHSIDHHMNSLRRRSFSSSHLESRPWFRDFQSLNKYCDVLHSFIVCKHNSQSIRRFHIGSLVQLIFATSQNLF
jgi:hypothetical protein